MSARVLVFCEGIWLAHTARPLAVARTLAAAGIEVHFGAAGRYAELPASEGFPVHPVSTMNPAEALAQIRSTRIGYNRRIVEEYIDDELTLIKRIKPDFILNDFRLPVAISARAANVPFANILNAYWTNFYAPARRAPEDFIATRLLGKRFATALLPILMKTIVALYARPFNAAARSRGLEPFRNIFDVMSSPHLNLICDLQEFAPLENAPEHFRFIGPVLWQPSLPPPHWLDDIDENRPVIYFSMGSTGFEHYFQALKHAFAGTDYQVVMTTGGADPGEMPPNFRSAALAPAISIIEKSDLVICHGGNGTIYQALSRGVPVLGIPTFHDQDFNMQRIEDLGLGKALYPRGLTPGALRGAAEALIADEDVRSACGRFAQKIAETDAPAAAAKSLAEAFAAG